jgi:hypothetical protein
VNKLALRLAISHYLARKPCSMDSRVGLFMSYDISYSIETRRIVPYDVLHFAILHCTVHTRTCLSQLSFVVDVRRTCTDTAQPMEPQSISNPAL